MPSNCLQSLMDAGHGILVAEAGTSHNNDRLNIFFPEVNPYLSGLAANKIVKWLDGLPIVWDDTQRSAASYNGRTLRSHTKDQKTLNLADLWTGASANTIDGRRTASRSPSPRKRMGGHPMGSEFISQSPPKRFRPENQVLGTVPEPWKDNGDSGVSGIFPLDSISNVQRGPDTISIAHSVLTILQDPNEPKIYPDCRELPTSTIPNGEQKSTESDPIVTSSSSVANLYKHWPENLQAIAGTIDKKDKRPLLLRSRPFFGTPKLGIETLTEGQECKVIRW